MKSLDIDFLSRQAIPIEMGGLLQKLGEYKGRQDLFQHQTPQVLKTLKQAAITESTESSNRIEGVTVPAKRFKELMAHPVIKPRDRSEAEILGYRQALSAIHAKSETFTIEEKTILEFHKQIYARTDIPAGQWKRRDNTIEECLSDGNGRVSRLLTVLLLHQADYTVGRYISIERLIEESKETYYEALQLSSRDWHEGKHNLKSWWEYSLGVLIGAYQEFEKRVGAITKTRGAKTSIVEETIDNLPSTFSISDIERLCSSVSRDMIRVVLNRLRKEDRLYCKGTGRSALWEKKRGNNSVKRGNKRGNNKR